MIGGNDNDLSSQSRHDEVVNNFLRLIANRWPAAMFHVTDDSSNEECCASPSDLPLTVGPTQGTVTICRDTGMQEHLDRFGLVAMADGEGPMVLFFWCKTHGCDLDLVTSAPASEDEFSAWAVAQLSSACGVTRTIVNEHH